MELGRKCGEGDAPVGSRVSTAGESKVSGASSVGGMAGVAQYSRGAVGGKVAEKAAPAAAG